MGAEKREKTRAEEMSERWAEIRGRRALANDIIGRYLKEEGDYSELIKQLEICFYFGSDTRLDYDEKVSNRT